MASRAPEDVLKEYLIAIGFQVDEPQYKKLKEKTQNISRGMTEFRDNVILTGLALSAQVQSMASDLEKLYFASQKTGSSTAAITSWGLATQAAGISAESATAAAERLALAVKMNPGLGYMLHNVLGVSDKKGSVEQMQELVTRLSGMMQKGGASQAIAFQYANLFGISPDDLNSLSLNLKDVLAQKDKLDAWRQSLGVTSDTLDEGSDKAHQFEMNLALMQAKFHDLKTIMESELLPAGNKVIDWMSDFVAWAIKADKATDGWSTKLLAIVGSLGAVVGFRGALGFAGRALGLGGGAAAAEGGAGAAVGGAGVVGAGLLAVGAGAATIALNKHAAEFYEKSMEHLASKAFQAMGIETKQGFLAKGLVDPIGSGSGLGPGMLQDLMRMAVGHEGVRHKVYKDIAGKDTVGVGHLVRPGENFSGILSDQAVTNLLGQDISEAFAAVRRNVKVALSKGQLEALTDFVFASGEGNFARSTLLKKLNSGDYEGAAEQFSRWDEARVNGRLAPVGQLTRMRANEEKMFRQGDVHLESHVTITGVSDPKQAGEHAKAGVVDGFSELLRNNNNLGAAPR